MNNTKQQASSPKTEITFYRLVECSATDKNSSFVDDVQRWESDSAQYLVVEEDLIEELQLPEPMKTVPF